MSKTIENRVGGGMPLSIGTSIALETMIPPINTPYDETRKPPKPIRQLTRFKFFYVNVLTLFRNLTSSIEAMDLDKMNETDLLLLLSEELEFIRSIVKEYSPLTKVIFYHYNLSTLYEHPELSKRLRVPRTHKQLMYYDLETKITNRLCLGDGRIRRLSNFLVVRPSQKAIIITNYSIDLLQRRPTLILLESHTGITKGPMQFNTKMFPMPKQSMAFLPFVGSTIMIFGTKDIIKPLPISKRQIIYDIGKKKRWTPMTNDITVARDIQRHVPSDLKQYFVDLPTID
jgi:hypothetical protein